MPHARSRKGYWHLAKTIASGVGLTNAWLAQQGLLSMKTLWAELAPLRHAQQQATIEEQQATKLPSASGRPHSNWMPLAGIAVVVGFALLGRWLRRG